MAETRQQKFDKLQSLTQRTVRTSAMTLAQYGLEADDFATIMCEALLANPDVMDCTQESVAKALRMACQDGLVPNGREAAIVTFRDRQNGGKQAVYMPMKEGLARLAHETIGVPLYTGLVREGDDVKVTMGAGIYQKIEISRDPFREEEGAIRGCYLWAHLPNDPFPTLILWTKADIDRRRAASRAADKGPWNTWYGEKAQTSIQKHFLNANRHLITSSRKAQHKQLLNVIEPEALEAGAERPELPEHAEGTVVETTATVVEPEPEPTPAQQAQQRQEPDDIPDPAPQAGQQGTFLPPREGNAPTDL